ncbi:MAG TPA: 50S ribosomal protein L11 [Candidatus Pacearchaeota archaeon]|jgi:large subunit ribosomal protein L11|nr:50S ribosomal protein L11 [Candidatus Pacearchaeota archaeon]HRR94708.1 50S ribosomal protein L11 [Candidatus Paceibacterota bacterium]HPC30486.1 50S ribosomal protein L11 [Candidatus Pacearchaeota archaeon]HQG09223.1 50S ribosomal protein L11 [Candidatus Pacearchaeota archaeon]HQH20157.1 50S ribosomal protein L11 [Candidatus Pacearchaeota archaeon]
MAKEIKTIIKLHIQAGKANPAPPVGPALASQQVNIAEFCKAFNDATKDMGDFKIPVDITVYTDKSYTFKLHQPPAGQLIKKAIGLEKGSGMPNKKKVGKITRAQLEEIAKQKMSDLNTTDLNAAVKIISGTAKSLGVDIVD